MVDLVPGSVRINVAEFLAALITCETFTPFAGNKYTTIKIDNTSAKSWLDSARCPKYPFTDVHRLCTCTCLGIT